MNFFFFEYASRSTLRRGGPQTPLVPSVPSFPLYSMLCTVTFWFVLIYTHVVLTTCAPTDTQRTDIVRTTRIVHSKLPNHVVSCCCTGSDGCGRVGEHSGPLCVLELRTVLVLAVVGCGWLWLAVHVPRGWDRHFRCVKTASRATVPLPGGGLTKLLFVYFPCPLPQYRTTPPTPT